jgi:hypothetical protein
MAYLNIVMQNYAWEYGEKHLNRKENEISLNTLNLFKGAFRNSNYIASNSRIINA